MATEGVAVPLNFLAVTDLSAKQFYAVKMSANNTVALCAAATDLAIGILVNKPNGSASVPAAAAVYVGIGRHSAAVDGTTDIAAGDWLGTSSAGTLVKKATGDYGIIAIALESCTTNGVEIKDVLVIGPGFYASAGG
jgi:hypothetical protein